jgi:transcriptional regulator with XRE-family HTH domain
MIRTMGARIRARRNELGLSLEEAAPRCGVHWSALGALERGQRNPSVLTLLRIARGLDTDPAEFVAGLEPTP